MSTLGIDIGGSTTVAVVLERGRVLGTQQLPTEPGEAVVATAVTAARRVLTATGIATAALEGVGLGVPGIVDADRSRVRSAVNLGIDSLDIGAAVAGGLGVPVTVDNDVRVSVLGARHLMGEPAGALAFVGLGTGIAAGVAYGDRVLRGESGVAGEIGHIPIPGAGERCRCGQHGCLETVAAGWALAQRWGGPTPAAGMLAAAERGDERGVRDWQAFTGGLAHAIRSLVLTTGVDTVLIGGGVSGLGAPLAEGIGAQLRTWASASPLLAALDVPSRIRLLPVGAQAGAVGAALLGATVARHAAAD
ncbi:ROK family protein [Agrococcus baldri]|uniref:NagC family transcriptional regulator n=1 Tax=Agrococcus baldri TaxID=153730 RepID=A0AA87RBC8_9MICO|nr:ROK family protein [Agrococcus baldri]GEK79924.1 NagC family transcriptional regulator [Agrococcus baldri]